VTTALEVIESALGLTNAVGVDQTLTADETADCLATLNDLIDSWSLERLTVYNSANETFNTVAGQAVYTIGPGGDWNTDRPIGITMTGYCTYQGVDFPVPNMTQEEYNSISIKTQQQQIVQRYLYVNDNPLGLVTLWPVPSEVVAMTFSTEGLLSVPALAATTLVFPPGYNRAFKYNLAVDLASLFGKNVPPAVAKIAQESLAAVKRANRTISVARFDSVLGQRPYGVSWQRGY
jgi:hypothetical protein